MLALNGCRSHIIRCSMCRGFSWHRKIASFCALKRTDPRFNVEATKDFLLGLGPMEVSEVEK